MTVDRELLEEQKLRLANMIENLEMAEFQRDALEGVLSLLEAISDEEGDTVLIELV